MCFVPDEPIDDIIVGELLLAVMADYVSAMELWNSLSIERLPDLLHEPFRERKSRLCVHRTVSPDRKSGYEAVTFVRGVQAHFSDLPVRTR
jgi:hypothetical protein